MQSPRLAQAEVRMKIALSCSKCGNNRFVFPDRRGDDAMVKCEECGHNVDAIAQLKERVVEMVLGAAWMRDERDQA